MSNQEHANAYEAFYQQYGGENPAWKLTTAFNDREGGAFRVYLDACVEMGKLRQQYERAKYFEAQVQSQHQLLLMNAEELRRLREQLTALHNLISIANNNKCSLDFKNITLGTLCQAIMSVESDDMHEQDTTSGDGGGGGGGAVVANPVKKARRPKETNNNNVY